MTSDAATRVSNSATTLFVGIAAFLAFAYWESVSGMFQLWQLSTHQHGLLVVPISLFLIFRLRAETDPIALRPSLAGGLLVAALVCAWILARLIGVQAVEQFSVLALLPATFVAIGGLGVARLLLFPLLFVLLAFPFGDVLVPGLMAVTADISFVLLQLSGIPVLRDGQYMSLPGGEFVVAEVCSGVRYLMSGVLVSLLYAYLTYPSHFKRWVFVSVAVVLLVFGNGLRAYLVMAIASASNMRYLAGEDHIYFGWVLFGLLIVAIMWLGGRFADEPGDVPSPARAATEPESRGRAGLATLGTLALIMLVVTLNPLSSEKLGFVKLVLGLLGIVVAVVVAIRYGAGQGGTRDPAADSRFLRSHAGVLRSAGSATAIVVLLLSGPILTSLLESSASDTVVAPDTGLITHCTGRTAWDFDWSPRMKKPDYEQALSLSCSERQVGVFVAAYSRPVQGHELVSNSNRIIPSEYRHRGRSNSDVEVTSPGADTWNIRETVLESSGSGTLVWYWYGIGDATTTSKAVAKLMQLRELVRGEPAGGHVVVLAVGTDGQDLIGARELLERLAVQLRSADMKTMGTAT